MTNPDLGLLVGFALGVFVMGAVAKTQQRKRLCSLAELQLQVLQEIREGNVTPTAIAEAEEFFRGLAAVEGCGA